MLVICQAYQGEREPRYFGDNLSYSLFSSSYYYRTYFLFFSSSTLFLFSFSPSHVFLKQLNELVRMPFFVWGVSPVSLDIQRDEFERIKNKINNKK